MLFLVAVTIVVVVVAATPIDLGFKINSKFPFPLQLPEYVNTLSSKLGITTFFKKNQKGVAVVHSVLFSLVASFLSSAVVLLLVFSVPANVDVGIESRIHIDLNG